MMRTPTLALVVEQLIADGHDDLAEYMNNRVGDTERLDFLEKQGDGRRWMARNSLTNRGYRLHQSNDAKYETARAAIDAAMYPLPDNVGGNVQPELQSSGGNPKRSFGLSR